MQKTAVVIGATGLVGKELVKQLLTNPIFSKITVLARRKTGITHPKFSEIIIDFDQLTDFSDHIMGDILFSCMGTTIRQAKTQENQYKVDYTYQYTTAEIAASNGISTIVLISSSGANSKSNFFYTRIKGELEEAISKLSFPKIRILRPSVLMGERNEFRLGERIGAIIINALSIFPPLKKYRGIKGSEVASAMIKASLDTDKEQISIKELDQLF